MATPSKFYSRPLDADQVRIAGEIRDACIAVEALLLALEDTEERRAAMMRLRETSMWGVAAVAHGG